jgi:hypothetical protein
MQKRNFTTISTGITGFFVNNTEQPCLYTV